MGLLYSIPPKKMLEDRKNIVVKQGIPALNRKGFEKAPFPESLYGRNNLGDLTYELCRLNAGSVLDFITIHISKGDSWIKIFLNVFKLHPVLESLDQLKQVDGMQFRLPPNSKTQMRLRIDDYKGIPLFRTVEHKLGSYHTEKGYQKSMRELGTLIETDLGNIDEFKKRWHEMHTPLDTDWSGKVVNA